MRIRIINPNTSSSLTAKIGAAGRAAAAPGTEVTALNPSMGPESIEGHYDEALCLPGLLEEVARGEAERADGYVIACFGDPGLQAARELATGPVVGIAEAAMHMASFIASAFSVVTTLERTVPIAEHLLERYGLARFCRRVHAADLPVLALENPGSGAAGIVLEMCRKALAEDGSGAIVLGCAGMADLCRSLSEELRVPVIDGVAAAVKQVEALVGLGLKTSKRGDLAYPLPKSYSGLMEQFSPPQRDGGPGSTRGGKR
jgi:allantoin racemase